MTDRQVLSGYIKKMLERDEAQEIKLSAEEYELIADALEEVDKLKDDIIKMIKGRIDDLGNELRRTISPQQTSVLKQSTAYSNGYAMIRETPIGFGPTYLPYL